MAGPVLISGGELLRALFSEKQDELLVLGFGLETLLVHRAVLVRAAGVLVRGRDGQGWTALDVRTIAAFDMGVNLETLTIDADGLDYFTCFHTVTFH